MKKKEFGEEQKHETKETSIRYKFMLIKYLYFRRKGFEFFGFF